MIINLPGNRALRGAFRYGFAAYLTRQKVDACPYADHRTARGYITFSRAFRHAWRDGWLTAERIFSRAHTALILEGQDGKQAQTSPKM